MSWWTESTTTPKRKSLFYVKISSQFFLPFVKTCSKPSANVETKEFKLINHYIKYPGLVKWNPITITMVDMNGSKTQNIDTATVLWRMLKHSGYNFPNMAKGVMSHNGGVSELTTPEKEAMLAASFGSGLTAGWPKNGIDSKGMTIFQVNPEGKTVEQWTLKNPIIKSIKWGDLSYEADEPVEYTLEVDYDWAELEHKPKGSPAIGTVYQTFMAGLVSQEDAIVADDARKEREAREAADAFVQEAFTRGTEDAVASRFTSKITSRDFSNKGYSFSTGPTLGQMSLVSTVSNTQIAENESIADSKNRAIDSQNLLAIEEEGILLDPDEAEAQNQ